MHPELKKAAIKLRLAGKTYPEIEKKLKISRSTLSGWLGTIKLSPEALLRIEKRKKKHLKLAREKSATLKKELNFNERKFIYQTLKKEVDSIKIPILVEELLLASLYLGEGFKRSSTVALGNSNPDILCFFVHLIRRVYEVNEKKFHCVLYLRADQSELKEKLFWSKRLKININRFQKTQFDKRTLGKKTWPNYHGVCAVYYNETKSEKRITALQRILLEKFRSA